MAPYDVSVTLDLKACNTKSKSLEKNVILEKINVLIPKEINEISEILLAESVIIKTLEDKCIEPELERITMIQQGLNEILSHQ